MKFTTPLALAAVTLLAAPAFAEDAPKQEKIFTQDSVAAMQGDIVIEAPYAVSLKKGEIRVFMTIHNGAKADDVLKSVSSEAASKAAVAEYKFDDGKMTTEMLDELPTPGNNAVMLDQDGYHFILTELKKPVEGGDTIPLVLNFAETGELEVEVSVAVMN